MKNLNALGKLAKRGRKIEEIFFKILKKKFEEKKIFYFCSFDDTSKIYQLQADKWNESFDISLERFSL